MPAPGLGFNTWIGIGDEVTYGVEAARTKFIEIIDESIKLASPPITKASMRGHQARGFFQGRKVVGGDISTELFNEGHEKLLKQFWGVPVTTSPEAGVFDHAFNPLAVLPIGLTLEVNRDTGVFVYFGCKVNQLVLSMVTEQVLRATYSIMGADEKPLPQSASAPTFPAELLPVFHQSNLTIDAGAFDVDEFTLTLNNNLAGERFKLGTRVTKEPVRNDLMLTEGSFLGDFDDEVQYNKYISAIPVALLLDVVGAVIGGSSNLRVRVNVPRAVYTGETPGVGGPGILKENFPFQGYAAEDLTVDAASMILTNELAGPV